MIFCCWFLSNSDIQNTSCLKSSKNHNICVLFGFCFIFLSLIRYKNKIGFFYILKSNHSLRQGSNDINKIILSDKMKFCLCFDMKWFICYFLLFFPFLGGGGGVQGFVFCLVFFCYSYTSMQYLHVYFLNVAIGIYTIIRKYIYIKFDRFSSFFFN